MICATHFTLKSKTTCSDAHTNPTIENKLTKEKNSQMLQRLQG